MPTCMMSAQLYVSAKLYDVCTFMISSYLYDVRSTVRCLSASMMSYYLCDVCLSACQLNSMMSVHLYDLFLPE
jgi:hypothetical protein